MADVSLTTTSYVVLGLVRSLQPCTPYDMKKLVGVSIGYFWPFPHSQLYAEPARLADHGLLEVDQEATGRRRRRYRLTVDGEAALQSWLREPAADPAELRDLGLLKLFFSAEGDADAIRSIAADRRRAHETSIAELEAVRGATTQATPAQLATLELGLRWNRVAADFWAEVEAHPPSG